MTSSTCIPPFLLLWAEELQKFYEGATLIYDNTILNKTKTSFIKAHIICLLGTNSADQDPIVTRFSKTYPNIYGNYSSSVIRHLQNIKVADRNGLHLL